MPPKVDHKLILTYIIERQATFTDFKVGRNIKRKFHKQCP